MKDETGFEESRTTLDGGGSQTPLILLLYSPSHIKRSLDFYPYYFEYAAKIDSATQVLGSYFLQDP